MNIRYNILNYHPGIANSSRLITVDVSPELNPTDENVIFYVKRNLPYIIEGERFSVIKTENIPIK